MDVHGGATFGDGFVGLDEQYTPNEQHSFDPFLSVSSDMPVHFQTGPHFPNTSSVQASQLFRNNLSSIPSNQQAQQSHHNFLALQQQMQASAAQAHQVSSTVTGPSTLGTAAPPPLPPQQTPKKPDDSDAACRPRLTPEQTQFLEDIFSHTPRPTTQQKKRHAAELGLTLEKVNNWFQNRRAKSKQMTRIRRELNIPMSSGELQQLPQWNDTSQAFPGSGGPSTPFHFNEEQVLMSMMSSAGSATNTAMSGNPWDQAGSATGGFSTSMAQNFGMTTPANVNGLPQNSHFGMAQVLGDLPSDWTMNDSNVVPSPGSSALGQDSVDMNQVWMSLGQQQALAQGWGSDHNTGGPSGSHRSDVETKLESVAASIAQSQVNSTVPSHHATPQRSPSPRNVRSQSQVFSEHSAFRRESTASDLVNNMNTFHLQRNAAGSTSEDDVFKTPKLPNLSLAASNLNLAARRKKERPAALQPMRTVSSTSLSESVPSSNSTAVPSTAVRRIKSAGNSLNAFSRVQKSGASSAQRSPLTQTFRDAALLEKIHTQISDMAHMDTSYTTQIGQTPPVASPDFTTQAWAISPSDSVGAAPPLSASYTQNSYEEPSWAASPPITPIYNQNIFPQGFGEVPQSAPAHVSGFPNLSPPPSHNSLNNSSYYTPQSHHTRANDPSFFAPVPMSTALHSQNHILKTYDGTADSNQPRIMRPGSSNGASAHYGFFTALAGVPSNHHQQKEVKELEVIMASFPTPEARPQSVPRANGNSVFTFQNTGPKDYASTSD